MRIRGLVRLAALAMVSPALAQTAQFSVLHDDPDGIVEPGQVVRIRHHMSRQGVFYVSEWAGDAIVSPSAGVVGAVGYLGEPPMWSAPLPFVHPGTASAGGVYGVEFAHPPAATGGGGFPLYPWAEPEVDFLVYDWTAPTEPGVYEFSWRESPTWPPGVRGYLSGQHINTVPVAATYASVTLTVIPAPAACGLLAAAMMPRSRRR